MFLLFRIYYLFLNKMIGTKSKVAVLITSENDVYVNDEVCMNIDSDSPVEVATNGANVDEVCLRINSNISVEVVTNRVFVVGRRFILSYLKKLTRSFGMRWNFYNVRSGIAIKCNRSTRYGSRVGQGLRNFTSIACGCIMESLFRYY